MPHKEPWSHHYTTLAIPRREGIIERIEARCAEWSSALGRPVPRWEVIVAALDALDRERQGLASRGESR